MAAALAEHLDSVLARLRAAPRLGVFSDFDGTLVPIVDDPMTCRACDSVRDSLGRLRDRPNAIVGIVSGRDLADLVPRIGVPGLHFAGNHGLEIDSPSESFRHPEAVRLRETLNDIVSKAEAAAANVPGAWVQNKGLTASVHYRQVDPSRVLDLVQLIVPLVGASPFTLRRGKAVLEVRPNVEWNKGHAIDRMMNGFKEPATAVFLGDDETDEDAFVRLKGHVTIAVGDRPDTAAAYRARDPFEVRELLQAVARGR